MKGHYLDITSFTLESTVSSHFVGTLTCEEFSRWFMFDSFGRCGLNVTSFSNYTSFTEAVLKKVEKTKESGWEFEKSLLSTPLTIKQVPQLLDVMSGSTEEIERVFGSILKELPSQTTLKTYEAWGDW